VPDYLRSKSYLVRLILAVLLVVIVGYFDYITGYQVSLFLFYGVPILFAVWFADRKCTALIVLLSAIAWWWADWKSGHPYFANWLQIWENVVRLFFFIFVAIGGTAIKSRRDSMAASVEDLRRLRELERDVVAASEREQHRIGADLHDGLCQYLAGIACVTRGLHDDLSKQCPPLAGTAAELHELLKDAVVQARNIARGITPVHMGEAGLVFALDELAMNTRKLHEIDCTIEAEGEISVPDQEVATHLYRIAQEALSNAVRHGHATEISIRLSIDEGDIVLAIHDNGIGLQPDDASSAGMGLRSMRYRAGVMNGSIDISASPDGGTSVSCRAPLSAPPIPDLIHAS
jgi:signal transduction histidine kinase